MESPLTADAASVLHAQTGGWGWGVVALTALAGIGLLVGMPTLDNHLLLGDDYQFCMEHLLVNRPSLAHAAELFRIVHRDLYQPIPMLSFQIDFVIHGQEILAGKMWGFYLTNVIIHILNGMLVWILFVRLTGRRDLSFVVAAMFLAHPLAIESVAWVSGRFMLLSGFFLFLTLIAFDRWQLAPSAGRFFWVVVWTLLCLMSKVRVELPVLLLILCYLRRLPLKDRRWWLGWTLLTVLTAAFAAINMFFSREGDAFKEPTVGVITTMMARSLLSLGWYFNHYVWPAGLSPWYPQSKDVTWSQPQVLLAGVAVIVACGLAVWLWRQGRPSAIGMVWFLSGIAVTLQLLPNRLTLAADRYAYIPIIGLHWMVASAVFALVVWVGRRWSSRMPGALAVVAGLTVFAVWVRVGRGHEQHYKDDVAWHQRCVELYPTHPGSWAKLAMVYIVQREYEASVEAAMKELGHPEGDFLVGEQVLGWAYFQMDRLVEAETHLRKSLTFNNDRKETVRTYYRLARVLEAQHRPEEAVSYYRRALARIDWYEPALVSLGNLSFRLGRFDEARRCYEKVLESNSHHVRANTQLGIIETQAGQLTQAAERFERLLVDVPEFDEARVQYAICLSRMNRVAEAIAQYDLILSRRSDHETARINRGLLYASVSDLDRAETDLTWVIDHVDGASPMVRAARHALHQLYIRGNQPNRAIAFWEQQRGRDGNDPEPPMWIAWSTALAGRLDEAEALANDIVGRDPNATLARLTLAYADYQQGRYQQAADTVAEAIGQRPHHPPEARPPEAVDAFRDMLIRDIRANANLPWPFYLFGVLGAATNQPQIAQPALQQFLAANPPAEFAERARRLLNTFAPNPPASASQPATNPAGDSGP